MSILGLALTLQLAAAPADPPDSHAYLSRCAAASRALDAAMDRLEADRGVSMREMRAKNANFATGIERLRLEAEAREAVSADVVEADRLTGEAAVTHAALRDVLVIMNACEAAHEVMD